MQQDDNTAVLSKSFGAIAGDYDRLRAQPPEDALGWLIPAGATDALEIGAGTGLYTRKLAEQVAHVTAIEPDARMRTVLSTQAPENVEVLEGQAEELPATDGSFDVVTAQSAWHWVDEERAIPEVARVLRPAGRLALVWNGTDRSVEWVRNLWAGGIELDPEGGSDTDRRRRRHHVDTRLLADYFGEPESKLFAWTRTMSKEDLIGLAATYSAVIVMDDGAKRAHLDGMHRYLEAHPELSQGNSIDVPMRAYCWRATRC